MSAFEDRRRKAEQIRHLIESEGDAVSENVSRLNDERYAAVERFDEFEALRTEARQIKEDAIENLPTLIDTLRESVEANGESSIWHPIPRTRTSISRTSRRRRTPRRS